MINSSNYIGKVKRRGGGGGGGKEEKERIIEFFGNSSVACTVQCTQLATVITKIIYSKGRNIIYLLNFKSTLINIIKYCKYWKKAHTVYHSRL